MSAERFKPDVNKRNALFAARNAGAARAMLTNLHTIHSDKKMLWLDEAKIWEERRDEFVARPNLRADREALAKLAHEALAESFRENVINDLSEVPAADPLPAPIELKEAA